MEILQDYDFDIRHRAGRLHNNADALTRRLYEGERCGFCQRVEDRHLPVPRMAASQIAGASDNGDCETIDPQQLQRDQQRDPVLSKVHAWMEAGQ